MGAVLGIAYRAIAAHLVRKAGLTQKNGRTGAVTLIQRFGSALNLNIHFHLLVLDGVYELTAAGPRFRRVAPPTAAGLDALLEQIVTRIARHLERRGLLVRDAEDAYLGSGPGEDASLPVLLGHSITYRVAVGPNEGRKAFTLQTVAPALEAPAGDERVAKHLHFTPGRAGAEAQSAPDEVPRGLRSAQRTARDGHPSGAGEKQRHDRAQPRRAAEAGVRHRDRYLRALRGEAEDHRQRRRPGGGGEESGASGAERSASRWFRAGPSRAWAAGAGGARSQLTWCHAPGIRARPRCLHLLPRAVRESDPHAGISGSATGG